MNRLFIILAFLLIISGSIFAQKSSILNVNPRTDLTVSPQGRLFAIDSVVDTRPDTGDLIGTWQYPTGKTAELHLKEGFAPTLANFLISSLPNFDNKLQSYTLLVREFNLNGIPETTRFEFSVTFCKRRDTQQNTNKTDSVNSLRQLVPIYKADIIVENNSSTITDVLKQGMAIAFLKFNNYLANPHTLPPFYSDFALEVAKAAQKLNLMRSTYDSTRTDEDNLLRCSQFRPGVYQSFSELRQNRPSLTGELFIQEKKGFANLRKPSGSMDTHRFFGFSDGKDLFISIRLYQSSGLHRQYAKVKSVGRYLLWIDNYVTSGEITASAVGGGVFGLLGGMAATSAFSSYNDCIALDTQTGGVFMVTNDKLPEMLAGHEDLLTELAAIPNQKGGPQQLILLEKLNQRTRPAITR